MDGWWASGKGSYLKRAEEGSASGIGRMGISEEVEVGQRVGRVALQTERTVWKRDPPLWDVGFDGGRK